MSAYIVDNKTINKIVSFFYRVNASGKARGVGDPPTPKSISPLLGTDKEDHIKELGQALLDMNVSAVNQRYNEHNTTVYTYDSDYTDKIGVYKAINCYLYQCSEGDIPETSELYKAMRKYETALAINIVHNLPAYENAEWG